MKKITFKPVLTAVAAAAAQLNICGPACLPCPYQARDGTDTGA